MIAHLFKRGRLYHGKIKLDTWATERRVSLGTTDKRVAGVELEKRLREFEAIEQGRLDPRPVRDMATKPLADVCAEFLTAIMPDVSDGTVKKYGAAFRSVIKERGWRQVAHVTERTLREWKEETKLRAKTFNDYLAAWYRLFRWLKRQRAIIENPCEFVDPMDVMRTQRDYRREFTPGEVASLLTVAPHPRALVYRLVLETGLRRKELRSLRRGDFNLGLASYSRPGGGAEPALADRPRSVDAGVSITRSQSSQPASVTLPASIAKNRKSALMPLSPATAAELVKFFGPDMPPFAVPFATCIPRVNTFRRDLVAAGIPFTDTMGRRADFHSLRGTAGTALVLSGAEPRVVMEFMRHSDLKLTMKTYMDAAQLQGPVAAAVVSLPWWRDSETNLLPPVEKA
jgi:integrase